MCIVDRMMDLNSKDYKTPPLSNPQFRFRQENSVFTPCTGVLPGCIIATCTLFFVLRFAISQAGIAARTLTLIQGSEGKIKNTSRIEPQRETWQTRAPTTTPQRRRCRINKVSYLSSTSGGKIWVNFAKMLPG